MKKIVALVAALFSVVVPVQSQAADQKALVIIDSYFDSRVISENVSCITTNGAVCTGSVKSIPTSMSSDINHGNIMVEVAKKQNPSLPIIAIRAGTIVSAKTGVASVNQVNAGNFIDALNWVNSNSSNIGAVSFSRNLNTKTGDGVCLPASQNTANYGGQTAADVKIRSLISTLNSKNIKVFAATGNLYKKPVDYPACILDTVSVSVGGYDKDGIVNSAYSVDLNTDYLVTSSIYVYKSASSWVTQLDRTGNIANTTSPATAAVAAKYLSSGLISEKVTAVLP